MSEYNFFADLLNKFHTSEPWIQAVITIGICGVLLGIAYFLKECVVAIMKPFCKHDKPTDEEPKKEWKDKYYRDGTE